MKEYIQTKEELLKEKESTSIELTDDFYLKEKNN
jgi:hypothetical protein